MHSVSIKLTILLGFAVAVSCQTGQQSNDQPFPELSNEQSIPGLDNNPGNLVATAPGGFQAPQPGSQLVGPPAGVPFEQQCQLSYGNVVPGSPEISLTYFCKSPTSSAGITGSVVLDDCVGNKGGNLACMKNGKFTRQGCKSCTASNRSPIISCQCDDAQGEAQNTKLNLNDCIVIDKAGGLECFNTGG